MCHMMWLQLYKGNAAAIAAHETAHDAAYGTAYELHFAFQLQF